MSLPKSLRLSTPNFFVPKSAGFIFVLTLSKLKVFIRSKSSKNRCRIWICFIRPNPSLWIVPITADESMCSFTLTSPLFSSIWSPQRNMHARTKNKPSAIAKFAAYNSDSQEPSATAACVLLKPEIYAPFTNIPADAKPRERFEGLLNRTVRITCNLQCKMLFRTLLITQFWWKKVASKSICKNWILTNSCKYHVHQTWIRRVF